MKRNKNSKHDRKNRDYKKSGKKGRKTNQKQAAVDAQTKNSKNDIRLNKYIANSGVCSRRDADIYIASGNVQVNGEVVTKMGYKVQLTDEVKFDGRRISPERKEYILLNKPNGFFVTGNKTREGKTVQQLIASASNSKLSPVGKLATETKGLLLFTNDGTLAKKLATPKNGIRQIYEVKLSRPLKDEDLKKIQEGVHLEDGKVNTEEISYIANKPKTQVGVELRSTKTHLLQRLFTKLGYEIVNLDRVVYGGLTKKDLPRGRYRRLNKQEVINLGML